MKKDELVNLIADHTDWKERVNASELADSILAALTSQIETQAYVHEHATRPHDHARFVSFDRSDVSKDFVCRALVYETADLEVANARIAALESERATLLHDVEIHARQPVYAYVYEYETAFGLHRQLEPGTYNGSEPARTVKVYAAPPSQPGARLEMLYDVLMRQNVELSSEAYLIMRVVGVPPSENEFVSAINLAIDAAIANQKQAEQ